jgi:hypothetical protein
VRRTANKAAHLLAKEAALINFVMCGMMMFRCVLGISLYWIQTCRNKIAAIPSKKKCQQDPDCLMFRKSGIKMFAARIQLIFCNIKFKIFKKLFKGCGSNLFGQNKKKKKQMGKGGNTLCMHHLQHNGLVIEGTSNLIFSLNMQLTSTKN